MVFDYRRYDKAPAGFESEKSAPIPSVVGIPEQEARFRILVVDDDRLIRRTVKRLYRRHDVVTVPDGAAACEVLTVDRGFDLILCDLMMPIMNGMSFHGVVSERWPEVVPRIVFMTGGPESDEARAFLKELDGHWLAKPFTAAELELVTHRIAANSG